MRRINFVFIIILFISFGCIKSNQDKPRINKFETIGFNQINESKNDFTEILKSFSLVPLESNSSSLFNNARKILKVNGKYYIHQYGAGLNNVIKIFTEDGKYIRTIDDVGKGPGHFIRIADFDVNPLNSEISIVDSGSKKIVVFDDKGNYIMEKYFLFPIKRISFIICQNETYLLVDTRSSNLYHESDNYDIFILDPNLDVIKKYFSFDKVYGSEMGNSLPFYRYKNNAVGYYRVQTDSIFNFNCDFIPDLHYKLNFPKPPVSRDLTQKFMDGEVNHEDYTYFISYFETEATVLTRFSYNRINYYGIYNKLNNSSSIIENDKTINIQGATSKYFISLVDPYNFKDVLTRLDATKDPRYSDWEIDLESNPYLLIMEF